MIQKLTQKYLHDPANGTWGDCWRTCIAMILGKTSPEDVPHFCDRGIPADAALAAANEWLSTDNLHFMDLNWSAETNTLQAVLDWHNSMQPGMPYMLTGLSRNGTNHCVVAIGDEIYCDPSIDQSGIIGPASDGFFYTSYLVYKAGGSDDAL